jgi:hypothetical protein
MSRWIVALLLPPPFMAGCGGSSEIAGDEPAVVEEVAGHEMEHPPLRRAGLYLRFGRPATKPSGAV